MAYFTFYDIPGRSADKAWSVNMWRARFALNVKDIPYKTIWLEYPEIEPTFKKVGISPVMKKADGLRDHYTCPAIVDSNTSPPTTLADSIAIIEYVDKLHPTPPLFPNSTKSLQKMFADQVLELMQKPLMLLLLHETHKQLNDASQGYFRETRERNYGKRLEDFCPMGVEREKAYEMAAEGFHKVGSYMDANGPFMLGQEITFADIYILGLLKWIKAVSEHEVWVRVAQWDGGKWHALLAIAEERYGRVL